MGKIDRTEKKKTKKRRICISLENRYGREKFARLAKREKDRVERTISQRRVDDTGFATHGSIEVPFLEPIVRPTRSGIVIYRRQTVACHVVADTCSLGGRRSMNERDRSRC